MAGGITQVEYWNGEVGARWARAQAVLDAVFAPFTDALLDRVGLAPGQRVLDVGCGTGATTLEAARRVGPAGGATGADISAPMLAVARARGRAEGAPARFVEADMQVADLGAGAFDHAISRFGVMFFPDSRAGFANLRRAVRPGGRITLVCWRAMVENPWFAVPFDAVLPMLPEPPAPPEPDVPSPFRFAAPGALAGLLRETGFPDVSCEAIDRDLVLGRGDTDAEAVAEAAGVVLEFGPTSRLLREAEAEVRARGEAAVTDVLRRHAAGGAVRLRAGCWLVQAG